MLPANEAIELCKEHLERTNSLGSPVEAFFVQYLLVIICAEYEQTIESLVEKRAARIGDPEITSFIRSATGRLFRSTHLSDIGGLLGRFSGQVKDSFMGDVRDTEAHRSLDTIVSNRDAVAHGAGSVQLTFAELVTSYQASKTILERAAAALCVPL